VQRVVDSICYGWDDPFQAEEGTRLKSGADIIEGECFLQIENPLEGSMLF
jgi:Cu+-exporting ATPase